MIEGMEKSESSANNLRDYVRIGDRDCRELAVALRRHRDVINEILTEVNPVEKTPIRFLGIPYLGDINCEVKKHRRVE